ncbi:MAG: BREX-1 system phosphatase PglZ type A [Bacteroidales bacterium]|nr:BREX-1 system phosphatase PglZ type A [Bacteroidales bacterium]
MSNLFAINEKVQSALEKIFQQHRLVFWYDDKAEMTGLFEDIQISGIEKLKIENNEFTLKHRIVVEQPKQRFLLYQPAAKPADNENWLLDLLVSNYEFHTESSSLYLQELGLPQEYKELIQKHEEFFANQYRVSALKELLEKTDRESIIRLKMLCTICACEPEWEKVLYALFEEKLKGKQDKYKAIEKFKLSDFLWKTIEKKYNYKSDKPTIKDLLVNLIHDSFKRTIPGGNPLLNKDAYLFISRWKENSKAGPLFKEWSGVLESELNIESAVQKTDVENLIESDAFSIIDKKIIVSLRDSITKNTLANRIIQEWIDKRKVKFFYNSYENIYGALSNASLLLDEIRKVDVTVKSPESGFENYEKQWNTIDRLYRKYIVKSLHGEHGDILKDLTLQIEKAYGNSFLLKLGDNWQKAVDKMNSWKIDNVRSQSEFYSYWIEPYVKSEKRIFVIISDAFRFESAAELRELILQEDKYTAILHPVLGCLPSYTQLGMASLLPQSALTYNDKTETVFADGVSTQGTPNRTKILQKKYAGSIAITAEEFLKMKASTEGRDFIKPYNVIYIYSNVIDKTGDDKTSENKVFESTEDELNNFLRLLKHITNMNGNNIIITSDHGYIYQQNRLDETDFTDFTPVGEVYKCNRRFVIGKNLQGNDSVKKWKGADVGLNDDTEVLIPKSINRIRISGAGSRFVHGGASLQEIVVPVLEVNKARKSNIEQVDIDIISGSSNITSNSFAVSFYQKQPIADKVLPRQLRAAFYTEADQLISDVVTLSFNSSENDALAREKRQTFLLKGEASKHNGQDVYLKMEEQIEGTNQYKTYKSYTFRMMIAFSSEFDS